VDRAWSLQSSETTCYHCCISGEDKVRHAHTIQHTHTNDHAQGKKAQVAPSELEASAAHSVRPRHAETGPQQTPHHQHHMHPEPSSTSASLLETPKTLPDAIAGQEQTKPIDANRKIISQGCRARLSISRTCPFWQSHCCVAFLKMT